MPPEITSSSTGPRRFRTADLFRALLQVLTPDGVQGSNGHLFKGAVFGRDAARVGLDLVPWLPEVSAQVIVSLASLQGLDTNPVTEEEPGRIPHEHRTQYVGRALVGREQQEILRDLAARWGGTDSGVTYFGTVDATPQLVRLIAAHVRHHGPDILAQRVLHRHGLLRPVRDTLLAAARWVVERLDRSDLGLLEFHRSNPDGHRWQVMRDRALAYLHEDGRLANAEAPIASLEAQGLAYDALQGAAGLVAADAPEEAADWRRRAEALRDTTLARFWMPDESFFAMALDRDVDGGIRQVRTRSTVPAELLETGLFDGLPNGQREQYVSALVSRMYGPDFLTGVGLRMRALRYSSLVPLWDYQGSHVCWGVTANVFAQGLRRQGLPRLADDMENRLLNAVNTSRRLSEFFYVAADGRVNYDPQETRSGPGERETLIATNVPENAQAWTISAALAATLRREDPRDTFPLAPPAPWQGRLEDVVLARITPAALVTSEEQLRAAFEQSPAFHVDTDAGRRAEADYLRDHQ